MIKALIKKQLLETVSLLLRGKKGGAPRSKASTVLYALLMLYAFGAVFFVFYIVMDMLCAPLMSIGFGWLYYALAGIIATAFGVIGSIFAAQSQLFEAKDNETLLAMPIPPSALLFSRMLGLYIQTFFFEALVLIPASLACWKSFTPDAAEILFCFLTLLLLPLLGLALTCILGWLVALISSRMRNKNLISILLSLGFLAAYFYLYSQMNRWLTLLITNSEAIGKNVKIFLYPLYQMGRSALGDPLAFLIFAVLVIGIFALVYAVLSASFLRIVTVKRGAAKIRYKESRLRTSSVESALLRREWVRFYRSSAYLLNCGLGSLLMLIMGIFALVKKEDIRALAALLPGIKELLPLIACAAVCMISSMNQITAPSVSLEGKTLWLLQSLPITGRQILAAKLKLHMLFSAIPAVLCSFMLSYTVGASPLLAVLSVLTVLIFTFLSGILGLILNLRFPNLNCTNEVVAVKQSISVMLSIFIGWAMVFLPAALWFAVGKILGAALFLFSFLVLAALLSVLLYRFLMTRGVRRLENLG